MIAAVIPAAGKSERMGRPKLVLEIEGRTLLARLIQALKSGGVDRIVVVTPPLGAPETAAITLIAQESGCELATPPERPPDMRASIELGLERLARPSPPEQILIAPGDSPAATAGLIAALIEHSARTPGRIVIPSSQGRRGHPIVIPWAIARELGGLAPNLGLNALVRQHSDHVELVEVADPRIALDLDTPADLAAWRDSLGEPERSRSYRVRLFAGARELAGKPEIEVELPPNATVADLRRALAAREPKLAPLAATALIAVDEDYAPDDLPLTATARLALIPPVSGGAPLNAKDDAP